MIPPKGIIIIITIIIIVIRAFSRALEKPTTMLTLYQIIIVVVLPPIYGGFGRPLIIRVLNDTGSDIMTLFYNEASYLGWQPNRFLAQQFQINSADGVTLRESISVLA